MANYTNDELTEALRAVNSIIHKCEKAQEKFPEGNTHHTLLRNRLKAMYISKALIAKAIAKNPRPAPGVSDSNAELLLVNVKQLHTTALGGERLKRNLRLNMEDVEDVVGWCRDRIQNPNSCITRIGKNWYIVADDCEITVNAYSFTIITAHRKV